MTDRLRRASTALAVAVLALQVPLGTLVQKSAPADRPSIVFILSDDYAYNALGIAGHPHLKTPNLDRLAREGAWFSRLSLSHLCAHRQAPHF